MSIWYYTGAEQQRLGPLSTDELKQYFRRGAIAAETLVWRDGMLQWRPLCDLAAQLGLTETPPADAGIHAAMPASPTSPPQPPLPPPPPAPEPPPPEPPPLTGRAVFSLGVEPSEAPPPRPAPAYASSGLDTQDEHNPYAPSRAPLSQPSALYGRSSDRDVVYAGFWKRAAATIIDGVILSIVAGLGGEALGTIFSDLSGGGEVALLVWILLVTIAMYALYFAWFHSSFMMATPGKLAIGIKVVRSDGEPIGFLHALARYIATIVSTIPLMAGYLMAGFTGRKQALHDMICDTVVTDKWAFTDQPGMQRRELGKVTVVVLVGYVLLMLLVIVVGVALGIGDAMRGMR